MTELTSKAKMEARVTAYGIRTDGKAVLLHYGGRNWLKKKIARRNLEKWNAERGVS